MVVGGTTVNPGKWEEAGKSLGRRVAAIRGGVESPLCVNVVYYVPGEVLNLDWEGVRTGSYDRRRNLLMVHATVPEVPPEDPQPFLMVRLHEAVTEAEAWARRKRIAEELTALRALVDRL